MPAESGVFLPAPSTARKHFGLFTGIAGTAEGRVEVQATAAKANGTHAPVKLCVYLDLGINKGCSRSVVVEITAVVGLG